uniref:Protein MEMO1 n=2 Tax=Magallana gigas TaxID=29159 RepID=K1QW47_MAGGI
MSKVRRATHAGSWYTNDGRELSSQLDEWLSKAQPSYSPARAIIAPHAGYVYCGACGGHAYRQIDPSNIKRIFILGPSHHVRLSGCALTETSHYQTPLYDLTIDQKRRELSSQLDEWLSKAQPSYSPARAIIAPHAGYVYCGACGGHAYRQIDPSNIKRIFILGPSHHVRLSGCALTETSHYQTPLYDLTIDQKINEELFATKAFEKMKMSTDEDEHSIEMHLPYIAKVMERRRGQFTIIPVLVGSLSADKEKLYGSIFSQYLADPENFFVISSDFCHWGQRFRYTFYDKSCGDIWQSIEALDKMGMDAIEQMDPAKFSHYLKEYENTICGRYPIGVLLSAIDALRRNGNGRRMSFKFMNYAQSSRCKKMSDSSVSYASGALLMQ